MSSHVLAIRTRTTCLLAVAAAAGVGGCGGQVSRSTTASVPPVSSPPVASVPAGVTLGCHQYCEQAGGYGGGQAGRPSWDYVKIDTTGTISPVHDAVPVTVTCVMPDPCRGAILLSPALPADVDVINVGRSDLFVKARATVTIAVPLSSAGLQAVKTRDHGHFPTIVIADFGDPKCPPQSESPCVAQHQVVINGASVR